METLSGTQYLRIFLHSTTHKALELQWLAFVLSADFRASLQEAMRLAQLQGAHALIADNRLLRALWQVDLVLGGELVFKSLSAAAEPLDAMNRVGTTALVANVIPNMQLESQVFPSIEAARAWATAPA